MTVTMEKSSLFQTEFAFDLPKGLIDSEGNCHKKGIMRLATAADEIFPVRDPRVVSNPSYHQIIVLSRVIIELGSLSNNQINPKTIESLFVSDLNFLKYLYKKINSDENLTINVTCPKCENKFKTEISEYDKLD